MDITTLDSVILDSLNMGIYYVDTDLKVQRWNKAIQEITGYGIEDLLGQTCKGNLMCHIDKTSEPLCVNACPLKATIQDGVPREALAFVRNKSGERIPIKAEIKPVHINGQIVGSVAVLNRMEIEQKKELVNSLTKIALTDQLTGLYNRGFIEGEINVTLSQMQYADRSNDQRNQYGILFLDIDDFSLFNNTYGHEMGDRILIEIGKAVVSNIRKTDSFCRWGGEEFVGIFQVDSFNELVELGKKILRSIRKIELLHDDTKIGVTASIGITRLLVEDTVESVIKRADELMYKSKLSGKDRYTLG